MAVDDGYIGSSLLLAASFLSLITCGWVVLSIYHYSLRKYSYHLQLVSRLLWSDIGINVFYVFYAMLSLGLSRMELRMACKFFLPIEVHLFICSYLWTCLLAVRFLSVKASGGSAVMKTSNSALKPALVNRDATASSVAKVSEPPIPYYIIWLIPLCFSLPVFIAAWVSGNALWLHKSDNTMRRYCTFEQREMLGTILNIVCFQVPVICTIIISCYFYIIGLLALRNAPYSVVARQMRKAGGYLFVLILAWLPRLIYTILTMSPGQHTYPAFLTFATLLTLLQGFFNVCVYVWSNRQMRIWLLNNLFFLRGCSCLLPVASSRRNTAAGDNTSESSNNSANQISLAMQRSGDTNPNVEESGSYRYSDEEDEEGGQNDTSNYLWAMISGLFFTSPPKSEEPAPDIRASTVNPIVPAGKHGDSNDDHPPPLQSALRSGARINSANLNKGGVEGDHAGGSRQRESSLDVDQEKFVRFGENTTRFISTSTGPSRFSDAYSNRGSDNSAGEGEPTPECIPFPV